MTTTGELHKKGTTMTIQTHAPSNSTKRLRALLSAACFAFALAGCAGAGVKTGQYIDDSTITTKVKSELAADEVVSAFDVHVETIKGSVRLSGFVNSPDQRRRAEQLARTVAGVQSVDNGLVVRNP